MTNRSSLKIYVAGHNGLVGSALIRKLKSQGYSNLITASREEVDLQSFKETNDFISNEKPDIVFLAAAKVGGIKANIDYPVNFLLDNIAIQSNVIKSSFNANVERLFFLGSSCIYPKNCQQPIKEEYLLSSELEITNRSYAIAKIAGIEMCWAYNRQFKTKYLALMPTNLYGINDNYDLNNSHVLPALIRKIHEAKIQNLKNVTIWGTGKPKREFLLSDDLADSMIFLMNLDKNKFDGLVDANNLPLLNVGSGEEISIHNLALKIKEIIGFKGNFIFDNSMPDGTYQKLMDSSKINNLGWFPSFDLNEGLKFIYADYKKEKSLL